VRSAEWWSVLFGKGERADGGGRGKRAAGEFANPMAIGCAGGQQFLASGFKRGAETGLEVQSESIFPANLRVTVFREPAQPLSDVPAFALVESHRLPCTRKPC
jgi:hypothetical protein